MIRCGIALAVLLLAMPLASPAGAAATSTPGAAETSAPRARDGAPMATEPSAWEQQKWRAEYDLKRRELDLKEQEQQRSTWSSPLVVAILAAAVAALGNARVAMINGRLQRELETNKAAEALRIEESRSEAGRILEMIKTGEADKAAANLAFLVDTGLIRDPDRAAQIKAYLANRAPGSGPVLPAADGRYTLETSEALTKPIASALEKSLDDFIAWLDGLGLKRDAERVSIRVQASGGGSGNAYYLPDQRAIVIDAVLAGDVDVPRREYSHHALMAGHEGAYGMTFSALESGLAWYLPCSFADRPTAGMTAAAAMGLDRPAIVDLGQAVPFRLVRKEDSLHYTFEGGVMWGSLLWDIRGRIGQPAADRIAVAAWQGIAPADIGKDRILARRVCAALLAGAGGISTAAREAVAAALHERGFPS